MYKKQENSADTSSGVAGKATDWTTEESWFDSRRERFFCSTEHQNQIWSPHVLYVRSIGMTLLQFEADCSSPSNDDI